MRENLKAPLTSAVQYNRLLNIWLGPCLFAYALRQTMTNCIPCIVFCTSQNQWVAHLESGAVGPFPTCDLALQIATTEALRLRRLGQAARVVVHDKGGRVCGERCLCERFGR